MAGEDRTEDPTPKRLQEARKRGQIAVSKELATAMGLLALFGVLSFSAGTLMDGYKDILSSGLQSLDQAPDTIPGVMAMAKVFFTKAIPLLAIPAAGVGAIGVAVGLAQTKFNIAWEALKPDIKKINPVSGLKRLVGYRGAVEVIRELFKVVIITVISYFIIWPELKGLGNMVGLTASEILKKIGVIGMQLGLMVGLVYLFLGLADYFFQRYSTKRELKMTREEVRQEFKQQDMSAEVKRAIKQKQMESSRKRMMAAVPEADVVITNPTHYSIALQYLPGEPAPKVVAAGVDLVAKDIRERAREAGVEIVENPPLARSLYSMCSIGDWVPGELYIAVAEVLAFVYRRRERKDISLEA